MGSRSQNEEYITHRALPIFSFCRNDSPFEISQVNALNSFRYSTSPQPRIIKYSACQEVARGYHPNSCVKRICKDLQHARQVLTCSSRDANPVRVRRRAVEFAEPFGDLITKRLIAWVGPVQEARRRDGWIGESVLCCCGYGLRGQKRGIWPTPQQIYGLGWDILENTHIHFNVIVFEETGM